MGKAEVEENKVGMLQKERKKKKTRTRLREFSIRD